jgi:hypothetical protein
LLARSERFLAISAYAGGTFVFLNSGGDSGKWTNEAWHTAG